MNSRPLIELHPNPQQCFIYHRDAMNCINNCCCPSVSRCDLLHSCIVYKGDLLHSCIVYKGDLLHTCIVYNCDLLHSCIMYEVDLLHSCIVYTGDLLHICIVYKGDLLYSFILYLKGMFNTLNVNQESMYSGRINVHVYVLVYGTSYKIYLRTMQNGWHQK